MDTHTLSQMYLHLHSMWKHNSFRDASLNSTAIHRVNLCRQTTDKHTFFLFFLMIKLTFPKEESSKYGQSSKMVFYGEKDNCHF